MHQISFKSDLHSDFTIFFGLFKALNRSALAYVSSKSKNYGLSDEVFKIILSLEVSAKDKVAVVLELGDVISPKNIPTHFVLKVELDEVDILIEPLSAFEDEDLGVIIRRIDSECQDMVTNAVVDS